MIVGKTTFQINEKCELSQDSYYTRNPEDANISMAIGPDSPESIFVEEIEVIHHDDDFYSANVKHDGIWEIYTDTAVGPFIALKLQEHGFETTYCDFSEQGMQDNGFANMDLEVA